MAINVWFVNRDGPGGGTRHLHQSFMGGETGSTCVGIIKNFARNGTNVIGLKTYKCQ